MATTDAILQVSDAIRELIVARVPLVSANQVVIESIDLLPEPPPVPRVTVFLYNIQENPQLKNSPFEVRSTAPGSSTLVPPPMVVDLDYLICAWTAQTSDEHRLLGSVLRALYDFPELGPAELGASWRPHEFVQLSLDNRSIEEQARIWTTFGFRRFKLSLYYRARIVPIETSRTFSDSVVAERATPVESLPGGGP
jgi:hypothetical protein